MHVRAFAEVAPGLFLGGREAATLLQRGPARAAAKRTPRARPDAAPAHLARVTEEEERRGIGQMKKRDADADAVIVAAAAALLLLSAAADDGPQAPAPALSALRALCAKLRPGAWDRAPRRGRHGPWQLLSVPPVPLPACMPSPWNIAAAAQEDAWIERVSAGCDGLSEGDVRWSALLRAALGGSVVSVVP